MYLDNQKGWGYTSPMLLDKKCGVYKIVNLLDGKCYVGSTTNFSRRFTQHRYGLKTKKSRHVRLQNAWNKYGADAFVFEPIEACEPDQRVVREQYWIDQLKPAYNMRTIAELNIGCKHTQEFKDGQRQRKLGRKHSEETKAKMRASAKRGPKPERGAAISAAKMGKPNSKVAGIPRPQSVKDAISAANKGKPVPIERREKISATLRAKAHK